LQISYRGEKRFIGGDKKITKIELPEKIKIVNCCKSNSARLKNLEANTQYTVSIVSMSTSQKMSESKELKIKTKVASSPPFPQPNVSRNDITDEYIPIYVHPASERYGPIRYMNSTDNIYSIVPLNDLSNPRGLELSNVGL
jgi:hypothetical protein